MKAVEAALADALKRVGKLYESCPEPRPDVNGAAWTALEVEIQDAIGAGNQSKGLAAVARWERHAEQALQRTAV